MTTDELVKLLNKAYKEYVKYPDVEIEMKKYRIAKVSIEGEVVNPGLYNLSGAVNFENDKLLEKDFFYQSFPTIFDAIRKSGGISLNSDLSNIKIIRKDSLSNGGGKIATTINLQNSILTGDYSNNLRIYDGDIILIPKSKNSNQILFSKALK